MIQLRSTFCFFCTEENPEQNLSQMKTCSTRQQTKQSHNKLTREFTYACSPFSGKLSPAVLMAWIRNDLMCHRVTGSLCSKEYLTMHSKWNRCNWRDEGKNQLCLKLVGQVFCGVQWTQADSQLGHGRCFLDPLNTWILTTKSPRVRGQCTHVNIHACVHSCSFISHFPFFIPPCNKCTLFNLISYPWQHSSSVLLSPPFCYK